MKAVLPLSRRPRRPRRARRAGRRKGLRELLAALTPLCGPFSDVIAHDTVFEKTV